MKVAIFVLALGFSNACSLENEQPASQSNAPEHSTCVDTTCEPAGAEPIPCGPDHIARLRVQPIDESRGCVDVTRSAAIEVGCASPSIPVGRVYYRECWENRENGTVVIAPVPLANLRDRSEWKLCTDQTPDMYAACVENACAVHRATTCSLQDTCEQIDCGGSWSPYRRDGCERDKGEPCATDDDCDAPLICSLFQPQNATHCGYRPSGECGCSLTTVGPTENGFCAAP
jgi:hypothetical protein